MKSMQFLWVVAAMAVASALRAETATLTGVRRGSDGSPTLVLRVREGAEMDAHDVGMMLDAAKARGGLSDQELQREISGRQYGTLTIEPEARPRVVVERPHAPAKPLVKRVPAKPAKPQVEVKVPEPKPEPKVKPQPQVAPPEAKPQKPDITIFQPEAPKGSTPPAKQ